MKDLLIPALNDAFILLEKRVPQTKKETKYVNIEDVEPLDIVKFMKDNNIPNNAHFGGKPNGYDAFDEICLCYNIDVPTTNNEKLIYKRYTYTTIAWKLIYDKLIKNGYKRIPFNSYNEFKNTTIYDMYVKKDFDSLVRYYSLHFTKE